MSHSGKTILVVEDETEILALLWQLLTSAGYEVLRAGSPLEAISICESSLKPIDVLLSDYNMPVLNGIELAEKLQKMQPHLKTIFISGNCEIEVVLQKRSAFLRKPIDFKDLLETIRKTLELSLGDAPAAIGKIEIPPKAEKF